MKITALVENQSNCELKTKHGLSLHVETPNHKILFDVGPDNTLFENSKMLGIDLTKVDTVILSHGHMDHGGVLGDANVLIMGCGHAGVVNVLEKAMMYNPKICVGGYHLWNPSTKKTVSNGLLEGIAQELAKYNICYYTCHCTGKKAYSFLAERIPDMKYLSCGEVVNSFSPS